MTFTFQKPYENVAMFLRRHWIILFFIYLRFAFVILAGILAFYLPDRFFELSGEVFDLALFLFVLYFLIIWQLFFRELTDFYLDAWIVTDHRILDINQTGLFRRDVSELRLSKIQDVSIKIEGILSTFLNYGNVVIQTAGVSQEFEFQQVADPQVVKDRIMELHDAFIKTHPGEEEIHERS